MDECILPSKFPYLTHVFAHQVCLVVNFHGLNFHCGSINRKVCENYMPRTFPGIRYPLQATFLDMTIIMREKFDKFTLTNGQKMDRSSKEWWVWHLPTIIVHICNLVLCNIQVFSYIVIFSKWWYWYCHDIGILIYRQLLYIARKIIEKSMFILIMSAFVQYHNNSSYQFCGTCVSECAVYTDTQSYQMQLSYASYYILGICNTYRYGNISIHWLCIVSWYCAPWISKYQNVF